MSAPIDLERMPPQDVEIEQALLSVLLTKPEASIPRVVPLLKAECFYHGPHAPIYQAILDVWKFDGAVDLHTINAYLSDQRKLDAVGGPVYLAHLATFGGFDKSVEDYARRTVKLYQQRQLIEHAHGLLNAAYEPQEDIGALSDLYASKLLAATTGDEARQILPVAQLTGEVRETFVRAQRLGRSVAGLDTGFDAINRYMNGLDKSELTVIAARPGIGKSTLARQIALNVGHLEGQGVGMFSLEMSKLQMMQCFACCVADIDMPKMRRGQLNDGEHARLDAALDWLKTLPIYIDDTPGLTVAQMRAAMMRLQAEYDIGLWIVDYLQLMNGEGSTLNEVVNSITKNLKAMSMQYEVPIIALSQLSRRVEERSDKRPQLFDLRDSGGIEQDAVNVLLIHRPGYYESLLKVAKDPEAFKGIVEFIFAKTRFGPTGAPLVVWDQSRYAFANRGVPLAYPINLDSQELEF